MHRTKVVLPRYTGWAKRLDWRCQRPTETRDQYASRVFDAWLRVEDREFWEEVGRQTAEHVDGVIQRLRESLGLPSGP